VSVADAQLILDPCFQNHFVMCKVQLVQSR